MTRHFAPLEQGILMNGCSFGRLVKLLNHQLGLEEKLRALLHLDSCRICRDAVYQLARDRDEALFVPGSYHREGHAA